MKAGTLISGMAHGALVAAAIYGLPWLSPRDREPVSVTSVSFVSQADFEAARSSQGQGGAVEQAEEVVLPPEIAKEPELPVVQPPERPAPAKEEAPATAVITPDYAPSAPFASTSRDFAAVSPDLVSPEEPSRVQQPTPRPIPRIAPSPQPPAPPQASEDTDVTPEVSPSVDADLPMPQEEATAPPEASPEPVTEAAPEAPEALVNVARPRSRPESLPRVTQPERAEPVETVAEAAPQPDAEVPDTEDLQSQLEALVASANNATAPTPPTQTQPTAPSAGQGTSQGPPLTSGEREGMRLAVQQCWNLPAGLRDAAELKVTLSAELTITGDVLSDTIRLLSPNPVPDERYQRAFDAGRRALIRCAPYDELPAEKYAQWRNLEIVFNPEGMVSW